jgi:L-serine/L-threonine ammonia-lyase
MYINTPLENAPTLATALQVGSVYLKLDNLQPSSSFKIRGLSNLIQKAKLANKNLTTIVSSSGGNAGNAATLAATSLGFDVVVFVPKTTPSATQELLTNNGARVVVFGDVWDETNVEAMKYLDSLEKGSAFYVHPFDHEDTWKGHSTLVKEIVDVIGLPDVLICSVGGGGLLCGILVSSLVI